MSQTKSKMKQARDVDYWTMTKLALAVGESARLHVAPHDRATHWTDEPIRAQLLSCKLARRN
jgi:hypothetical protein